VTKSESPRDHAPRRWTTVVAAVALVLVILGLLTAICLPGITVLRHGPPDAAARGRR
jgi:hypothetical protein